MHLLGSLCVPVRSGLGEQSCLGGDFVFVSGQAAIAGLEGSGDIVSVSCTENEIFLLKGDRNIIRISSRPEGLASIGLYWKYRYCVCAVAVFIYNTDHFAK